MLNKESIKKFIHATRGMAVPFSVAILSVSLLLIGFNKWVFSPIPTWLLVIIGILSVIVLILSSGVKYSFQKYLTPHAPSLLIASSVSLLILGAINNQDVPFMGWAGWILIILAILASGLILISGRHPEQSIERQGSSKHFLVPLILISLAFGAYLYNLNGFGPQGDEWYHVTEARTYFNTGKLFYTGPQEYGRSKITTLIVIGMGYFSKALKLSPENLFFSRLPFVIFSIASAGLIYIIAKKLSDRKIATAMMSIFLSDIWFIYHARNIRFYSISLFFILLMIYGVVRLPANKKILIVNILVSLLLYKFLISYFLFIAIFFLAILVAQLLIERSYKYLLISLIGGIFLIINRVLYYLQYRGMPRDNISWALNIPDILKQLYWATYNYPLLAIATLFATGLIIRSLLRKEARMGNIIWDNIPLLYAIFNVIILLAYISNVPYTLTFRTWYFILPIILIVIAQLIKLLTERHKKIAISMLCLAVTLNIYNSYKYFTDQAGDRYFPTKLLYEKQDIVWGDDIYNEIYRYGRQENINNYKIVSVGFGSVPPDSPIPEDQIQYFRSFGQDELERFQVTAQDERSPLFIIVWANAYENRENVEYYRFWNQREFVTEVEPKITDSITSNPGDYRKIFTSADGFSTLYYRKN